MTKHTRASKACSFGDLDPDFVPPEGRKSYIRCMVCGRKWLVDETGEVVDQRFAE